MNNKDMQRDIEKSGTKICKEKLIEAIKKSSNKEFHFFSDNTSDFAVVTIKLN